MAFEKLKNRQFLNLATGLICQLVTAVAGLILPSMIIKTYGSVLNGLVSTITQMMSYLSLVEAGLTSASLVSLFKPMAEKNYETASSIMAAINKFYIRVANIFLMGSLACGIAALFVIKDDIPQMTIWLVTFSVAGASYVSFRLLNKYRVLLQADNRIFMVNIVHSVGVVFQFCISVFFIRQKFNIAATKGIIIGAELIEWFFLLYYTHRIYPGISLKASPKLDAIKQRKDIIVHQVLSLVLNNTDVLLLAVFSSNLSAVSVYTVYAMIGTLIHNALNSFISMFSAKMGQRYAVGDYEGVQRILKRYEVIYNIALYSAYCCMAILILPFICVYTKGVSDAKYYDPMVGLLFSIYGITRMVRLPYSELTSSAGHFKETRIQAVIEASTNLIISMILLPFMGIPGVLIGSIAGEVYRTIHTYYYCEKKLLRIDWLRSIVLTVINGGTISLLIVLFRSYRYKIIDSYFSFFVMAVCVCICVFAVIAVINVITTKVYYKVRG